ncbi:MAG: hypothetical protein U0892_22150 [Pirellulales bacterium]
MTGLSTQDAVRPAKRMRPSAAERPQPASPPVLFRLPSLGGVPVAMDAGSSGAAVVAPNMQSTAAVTAPSTAPAIQPALQTATAPTAQTAPAVARSWWEHWSSGVVLIVLIMALVILTIMAMRTGQQQDSELLAEMGSRNPSGSKALEALDNLQVPNIQTPGNQPDVAQNTNAGLESTSSQPQASGDVTSDTPASDVAKSQPSLLEIDPAQPSIEGELASAASTVNEAAKPSSGAPKIQLGTPIPAGNFAARPATPAAGPGSLSNSFDAATNNSPRFETVSGSAGIKPSTATGGSSPGLWDGQNRSSRTEQLVPDDTSLIDPSLVDPSFESTSAAPRTAVTAMPTSSGATNPEFRTAAASTANGSLGVTVGGGMKEPTTMRATNTPELDSAGLSRAFIEFTRGSAAVPSGAFVRPSAASNSNPIYNTAGYVNGAGANMPASNSTMPAGYAPGSNVMSGSSGNRYQGATAPTAQPGAFQNGSPYQQPTMPSANMPPANYQQPGNPQLGYQPSGYQQPGYVQPGYQQPTYQQPGLNSQSNMMPSAGGLIGQAGYATPPTGDFVRPQGYGAPASGTTMPVNAYGVPATGSPLPGGVSANPAGPAFGSPALGTQGTSPTAPRW